MSKTFTFKLARPEDKALIRSWWTKPHVMEFWDNTPEMWTNVENYFLGKKELFDYWVASVNNEPFALLMTSDASVGTTPEDPMFKWLAPEGLTMTIDFMIGEETFLGLGLSYQVLQTFGTFIHAQGVNALLIDPEVKNTKAIHVYERAGFKIVESFIRKSGAFAGIEHLMMKMDFPTITFQILSEKDCSLLHAWLQEKHVMEFWDDGDRTLEQVRVHYLKKDDVYRYLFLIDNTPAGYIQSFPIDPTDLFALPNKKNLGIDFFIGNLDFLNKGLAVHVLENFITIYCKNVDRIIVDPELHNQRALHIYKKQGFVKISTTVIKKKSCDIMALDLNSNKNKTWQ